VPTIFRDDIGIGSDVTPGPADAAVPLLACCHGAGQAVWRPDPT
jgi:hypothetical protein